MFGHGSDLADLIDLGGNSGGVLNLAAVDGLGLDSVVNLTPRDVVGSGAQGLDGLGVGSGARGADHDALQVRGGLERLVAHEGAGAVKVVVAQGVQTLAVQLVVPCLEGIGRHDLHAGVIVVDKVSHVQDAHVVDVAGHTARVCQDGDAHALERLVDHVLLDAELAGGVDRDLDVAVGIREDLVRGGLHAGVDHGGVCLGGGELELIGLVVGAGRCAERDEHAQDECECENLFHRKCLLVVIGKYGPVPKTIFYFKRSAWACPPAKRTNVRAGFCAFWLKLPEERIRSCIFPCAGIDFL